MGGAYFTFRKFSHSNGPNIPMIPFCSAFTVKINTSGTLEKYLILIGIFYCFVNDNRQSNKQCLSDIINVR